MTMGASVGSVKREPDSEERDDSFEDSFLLACLLELFRSHMSAAVSRSFFYFLGPPLLFLTAADSWPCFPASPGRAWRLPSYTRKTSWASSPAAPYNPGNRLLSADTWINWTLAWFCINIYLYAKFFPLTSKPHAQTQGFILIYTSSSSRGRGLAGVFIQSGEEVACKSRRGTQTWAEPISWHIGRFWKYMHPMISVRMRH